MWITKKTYEELVENNKALKKMNLRKLLKKIILLD